MVEAADLLPPLQALLADYERALTRAISAPAPQNLRETDAAFARLRSSIASCSPIARARADALQLACGDLLGAVAAGEDRVGAHAALARALFEMRVALHGAAREHALAQFAGEPS